MCIPNIATTCFCHLSIRGQLQVCIRAGNRVNEDVPERLEAVLTIFDAGKAGQQRIETPPLLMSSR